MKLLDNVMKSATSLMSSSTFILKKHSPEILVLTGVAGSIASTIMACKATTKLESILEEHKERIELTKKYEDPSEELQDDLRNAGEEYTPEDAKKDLAIIRVQTGVKIAKLYAPAVLVGALSIASILGGFNILNQRFTSLGAAYAALKTTHDEYRERVRDRFGDDVENQILHGTKLEEIEERTVNKKGEEKVKKKTIEVADPGTESDYVKYFTRTNKFWEEDESYLMTFFKMVQCTMNDKLRSSKSKCLVLNQVYDALGFEMTKSGMVVGWIYDLENPVGDNYIEFNIRKVYLPNEYGGYEKAYAIDFNVDGNIYDRLA